MEYDFGKRARRKRCFFCGLGQRVGEPFIMWQGLVPSALFLHPSCALDLIVRLMRDVWEYQNVCDGRSEIIVGRAWNRKGGDE
jgi:hypothetical protein